MFADFVDMVGFFHGEIQPFLSYYLVIERASKQASPAHSALTSARLRLTLYESQDKS